MGLQQRNISLNDPAINLMAVNFLRDLLSTIVYLNERKDSRLIYLRQVFISKRDKSIRNEVP